MSELAFFFFERENISLFIVNISMNLTVLHLEITHWLWVKFGWQEKTTGSRGPGIGPSGNRSGGTGDSHPGIKVPDLSPGLRCTF